MKASLTSKKTGILILFSLLLLPVIIAGCSLISGNPQLSGFLNSVTGATALPSGSTPEPETNTASETGETAIQMTKTPVESSVTILEIPETAEPTPINYTVELWIPPQFDTSQDTPGGKALQEAISAYQETHPNVSITLRVKASSGDSSMLNTVTAANHIAQEVLPSLALVSRSDMETLVQRGLLQPITSSVFADSNSWYSYARQSAVIDNTIYGIPLLGDGMVLTYRTSKVGTELTDWQNILTRGLPIGFAPSSSTSLFGAFIYLINGGKLTNDQGTLSLDQQKLTDTLNFFLSGGQNGAFPPSLAQLVDQGQVWQRFNDGTMSIIISQFSSFRHYRTTGIEAIALPLPEGTTDYPLVNTWNLVLFETNESLRQEAINFAEYLVEANVNDTLSVTAGYLPVRNNEHDSWQEDPELNIIRSMCENGVLIPNNSVTAKIIPIINTAVSQVIRNQQTPETAAQEAIASLN